MKLLEHQGKALLAQHGIRTPGGRVVTTADAAAEAASDFGRVAVKAQVASGKRGKAGGVLVVDGADAAREAAAGMLGRELNGLRVDSVIVEEAVGIERELYCAVLPDPGSKGPVLLFTTAGGMEVEEVLADSPERMRRLPVDIVSGVDRADVLAWLAADLESSAAEAVASTFIAMYDLYRTIDAALVEINPLVVTADGEVVALDSKISIDPSSHGRQQELIDGFDTPAVEAGTPLEERGRAVGLNLIELDGNVGVLANGAGLTMTTIDVIRHYGGRAANFLEIGGDSYTKATPALELVLSNRNVKSILVNFCGAFARTDVMAQGVVEAIETLQPQIPISFTIHGTGEEEAIALVRDRLGVTPHDLMDDAVREAIAAADGREPALAGSTTSENEVSA